MKIGYRQLTVNDIPPKNPMIPIILLVATFVISLFFLLFFRTNLRQKRTVTAWRQSLLLDKHEAVFQQLYTEVDGFVLSKEARKEQDAFDYVYGEIEFTPFIALLSLCHPDSSTIFYDLGSGTGKAVLACAMVFDVKKSCGIELFSELHHCAQLQQEKLKKTPGYAAKAKHIELRQGDFLNDHFKDATLIFINATAFFGDTWTAICALLETLNASTVVITTSKAVKSNLFTLVRVTKVQMSWGVVDAYIQQHL